MPPPTPFHNISQEVYDLAKHHFEILRHRFPNYIHDFYDDSQEYESENCIGVQVSLEKNRPLSKGGPMIVPILIASFTPSYVRTWWSDDGYEMMAYADPRFTDDILSDKVREAQTHRM